MERPTRGQHVLWMQFGAWGVFFGSAYAVVERCTEKRVTIRVFDELKRCWELKSVKAMNLMQPNERQVMEITKLENEHPYTKANA